MDIVQKNLTYFVRKVTFRPGSEPGFLIWEQTVKIQLEFDRETDGRWIAEAPDLPGVLAYGESREQAAFRAQALALRVIADRLENGELAPAMNPVSFDVSFYEPMAVN